MSTSRIIRSLRDPGRRFPEPVVLGPFAAILFSEMLVFFGFVEGALYAHVLTLLVCTLLPVRYGEHVEILRAFALVPLFRLVNLGMPVFFQLTIGWFPLVYGPLIPGLFLLLHHRGSTVDGVDWRVVAVLLPLSIPVSWVLAEFEYAIIQPEALVPTLSLVQLAFITVIMVGFVGLVEELLFRGIFQRALEDRFGRLAGLVVASSIFGLMHSGYGVPAELVYAGVIGLVFGVVYDATDSIVLVTVMHGMLNVFLFAVIPHEGTILLAMVT